MKKSGAESPEKNFKKLLVLLVIIVVLSLVVNLFSLNALYNITGGNDNILKGSLFTSPEYTTCIQEAYRTKSDMELAAKQKQDSIIMNAVKELRQNIPIEYEIYQEDLKKILEWYKNYTEGARIIYVEKGIKVWNGMTIYDYINNGSREFDRKNKEAWNSYLKRATVHVDKYNGIYDNATAQYWEDLKKAEATFQEAKKRCGEMYDEEGYEEPTPKPDLPTPTNYYPSPTYASTTESSSYYSS